VRVCVGKRDEREKAGRAQKEDIPVLLLWQRAALLLDLPVWLSDLQ
jgi:hypothetical protein